MANRSHLYSSEHIPDGTRRPLTGIAEWSWDVPLVFKILVSDSPRACRSSIWELDEDIAIVANYEGGVKKLRDFLKRIERQDAQPLLQEALDFLENPENRNTYFILEPGEIYECMDEEFHIQNANLIEEILRVEDTYDEALKSLTPRPPRKPGLLKRWWDKWMEDGQNHFRRREPHPLDSVYELGLGNWRNTLFYDLSQPSKDESKEDES